MLFEHDHRLGGLYLLIQLDKVELSGSRMTACPGVGLPRLAHAPSWFV
jgi:hypothetical protein